MTSDTPFIDDIFHFAKDVPELSRDDKEYNRLFMVKFHHLGRPETNFRPMYGWGGLRDAYRWRMNTDHGGDIYPTLHEGDDIPADVRDALFSDPTAYIRDLDINSASREVKPWRKALLAAQGHHYR